MKKGRNALNVLTVNLEGEELQEVLGLDRQYQKWLLKELYEKYE